MSHESLIEKLKSLAWTEHAPGGPDEQVLYLTDAILSVHQHAENTTPDSSPCPFIVTSREGTSFCRLAEQNGAPPREDSDHVPDTTKKVSNCPSVFRNLGSVGASEDRDNE